MSTILDSLVKNNEYPIVFIGSGISKRFLTDFPDWASLLKEFWNQTEQGNFYGQLNLIKDAIKNDNPALSEKENEYLAFIRIGSIIESKYNIAFNNGQIILDGFSPEKAFKRNIS